jgi:hypothetical protein
MCSRKKSCDTPKVAGASIAVKARRGTEQPLSTAAVTPEPHAHARRESDASGLDFALSASDVIDVADLNAGTRPSVRPEVSGFTVGL